MHRFRFNVLAFVVVAGSAFIAPQALASLVAFGPWVGAVTSESAVIVAKLDTPRLSTLELSEDRDFTQRVSFGELTENADDQREMAHFRATGLRPATRYYYRLRAGADRDDDKRGTFTTFPAENTPASFTFAFASCAYTGSAHAVFAEIKYQDPLFYLCTGDLHYEDIAANDRAPFRAAYERVLASPTQSELYRNVPFVYVWDDHDYGPNGSDRHSPSRAAAHGAYREYVPHYPLASAPEPDGPIAQAFTVGRVRFLVLDTRTARDAEDAPDDARKTMLGAWQKAWLKEELLAARGRHPLTFIVSSVAWISNETTRRDNWGRYTTERRELANWMVENAITGVCFLGGDAHMLAADDGSHNTYADHGGPGYPSLQAAPLDQKGSIKGGPWSVTPALPNEGEGQFGLVTVTDAPGRDQIDVLFRGMNHSGREKLRLSFSIPVK